MYTNLLINVLSYHCLSMYSCRNYIVLAINESIHEIIRVLQLTSPTEEAGAFASSTGADGAGLPGGLLPGTLAAKIYTAKDLIAQTGEKIWAFSSLTFCNRILRFITDARRR